MRDPELYRFDEMHRKIDRNLQEFSKIPRYTATRREIFDEKSLEIRMLDEFFFSSTKPISIFMGFSSKFFIWGENFEKF